MDQGVLLERGVLVLDRQRRIDLAASLDALKITAEDLDTLLDYVRDSVDDPTRVRRVFCGLVLEPDRLVWRMEDVRAYRRIHPKLRPEDEPPKDPPGHADRQRGIEKMREFDANYDEAVRDGKVTPRDKSKDPFPWERRGSS